MNNVLKRIFPFLLIMIYLNTSAQDKSSNFIQLDFFRSYLKDSLVVYMNDSLMYHNQIANGNPNNVCALNLKLYYDDSISTKTDLKIILFENQNWVDFLTKSEEEKPIYNSADGLKLRIIFDPKQVGKYLTIENFNGFTYEFSKKMPYYKY